MVSRRDYTKEAVDAARSVLIEVLHIMGEYRDNIVLVGGWIPYILCTRKEDPHVGSIDIDLALDHRKLKEEGYKTIEKLLLSHGYTQGKQPYIFYREINREEGNKIIVEIDLLAGEHFGTTKSHRHQRVQDVLARKVRGCDLAFEINEEIELCGELPDGGKDSITMRVVSVAPFLVMKGYALDERLKEKDAYDIYYCLNWYQNKLDNLVEVFKPYLKHSVVQEGLKKIKKHFSTIDDLGSKYVADFYERQDSVGRELIQRDAYEKVNYFLDKLDIQTDQNSSS